MVEKRRQEKHERKQLKIELGDNVFETKATGKLFNALCLLKNSPEWLQFQKSCKEQDIPKEETSQLFVAIANTDRGEDELCRQGALEDYLWNEEPL